MIETAEAGSDVLRHTGHSAIKFVITGGCIVLLFFAVNRDGFPSYAADVASRTLRMAERSASQGYSYYSKPRVEMQETVPGMSPAAGAHAAIHRLATPRGSVSMTQNSS
ncbi:hypothetical protein BO86DRAFT_59779 [Aspergillus japonicus CBS 114.51]|uniref:Uncharacterized protein n=1 Tax=Aspergillus japonicus CBS 114.51 TaxID=1448312 RepID=A0A8T8X4H7_ASPJA|nr:hypothetical protein BO86DRAFT_59779 [Aspergillus japonicus CBS 114.51]RAH83048.1 hypothetical protein BO86DRAFT_59779 [Aspergillus japonicus CBS 114.51]